MKKIIFLFLLLSFYLYSASLPQGLIKETENGITRISTTNPNFKMVMEIWGNNVILKWESIFKNNKGFIYSEPTIYGYDYGEKISDFGNYKLFTIPIGDFGQVLSSPSGYVVPAPYVIDINHPVYSVNNLRYLIYAFILDPLESTELYGYRAGIYAKSAYITLNKKDMEEVKKLLEYYIDYTKENNINIFQDYYNNTKSHQEIMNNLEEKANTLKNQRMEIQKEREEAKKEYEDRFQIINDVLIYNGDKITIEANIKDYGKYAEKRNNGQRNADYVKSQNDFRYYITFKDIKNIKSIEFKSMFFEEFKVYSEDIENNKIAVRELPDDIIIINKRKTIDLSELLFDYNDDYNALILNSFWGHLHTAYENKIK